MVVNGFRKSQKLWIRLVEDVIPKLGMGRSTVLSFLFDLDEAPVVGRCEGITKIFPHDTIDEAPLYVCATAQVATTLVPLCNRMLSAVVGMCNSYLLKKLYLFCPVFIRVQKIWFV